jgi:hypothetical protein
MPEQNADQRKLAEAVREILADVRKHHFVDSSIRPVDRAEKPQPRRTR